MRRGSARAGRACVPDAPDRLAVPRSYLRGRRADPGRRYESAVPIAAGRIPALRPGLPAPAARPYLANKIRSHT
jgi:hypothetical protein